MTSEKMRRRQTAQRRQRQRAYHDERRHKRFIAALRQMTRGRGIFVSEFVRYPMNMDAFEIYYEHPEKGGATVNISGLEMLQENYSPRRLAARVADEIRETHSNG